MLPIAAFQRGEARRHTLPAQGALGGACMTSFEFVFGMISVITSLALARLLGGCVGLYRHAEHVRFSFRHACWTAMAFMLLIGNWAKFWRFHDAGAWGPLDVLIPLVFVGVLYAFCDLVLPEEPKQGEVLDLREYHAHQGRRYKAMQLVFSVLAMLVLARSNSDFGTWFVKSGFALIAAACTVVALRTRRVWLDTAAAVVLALIAPVFMWTNLEGLAG
jgi:hypothetical protein